VYYWVGLQLVLRAALFGVSSLERSINLVIGIILLTLNEGIRSATRPFKSQIKNHHEQIFNMNIIILLVTALYDQDMIAVNAMIGLAMVHFSLIIIYHIIILYVLSGVTRNGLLKFFRARA